MKINQMTFYAMRAIRVIYQEAQDVVTSKVISEKEGISQGVLIKTLRILCSHGILNSHQGRGRVCGGFSLRKSIDEISFLDIIQIMEGEVDVFANAKVNVLHDENALFDTCDSINERFKETLAGHSIKDFFELD